jgi:3-methyladenine DNA glycosylase AlkD
MELARMASALIASLRRDMNGAVVADMESRGLHYERNYGVSLHTVRTAAREWAPNHDFAKYLWKQPVREFKLAAVAMADPRAVTPEEVEFWLGGVTNVELAENVASYLLSRTALVRQVAENYVVSANPLLIYTAILTFVKGYPADTIAGEAIEFSKKIHVSTPYIERATELLLLRAANDDEKE